MSGRIDRTFIRELIAQTDIAQVIHRYTPLKQRGNHLKCCCPFHGEKTPSFTVSSAKQFFYCFGCHAHGNAIDFIVKYEKVDFVTAIETLASIVGVDVRYETQDSAGPTLPYQQAQTWLQHYAHYYTQHTHDPEAQAYINQRQLNEDTLKKFQLGYAPKGWQTTLNHLKPPTSELKLLHELGMVGEGKQGAFDRLRHRLVFPISNPRGQIIAFGSRAIDPEDQPKYLNSPEHLLFKKRQVLYGLHQAQQGASLKNEGALVVEGYMDVVKLHQHGFDQAVATLGTAMTDDHIKLIQRYTRTVTFCFDGDRAGQEAAWRASQTALPWLEKGLSFQIILLPEGQDPDSLLQTGGADSFREILAAAIPLTRYFFDYCRQGLDLKQLNDRLTYTKKCLTHIHGCSSTWVQTLFLNQLSEEVGVPIEELRPSTRAATPALPIQTAVREAHEDPLIDALIRSLILNPKLIGDLIDYAILAMAPASSTHAQLYRFLTWLNEERPDNTALLLESLRHTPARYRWVERFDMAGLHYDQAYDLQTMIDRLCRTVISTAIDDAMANSSTLDEGAGAKIGDLLKQRNQLDQRLQASHMRDREDHE